VVCQIDVLARLEPRREVVKNALVTLPGTLDETYERIFLQVPRDARRFVHSALKWVYSHTIFHNNNVPCAMLLHLVRKSLSLNFSPLDGYDYDLDLLRDFCGCLLLIAPETRERLVIETTPDDMEPTCTTMTATLAHHTVWEFLESTRMRDGLAAFFAVDTSDVLLEYTTLVFFENLDARPTDLHTDLPRSLGENAKKDSEHIEQSFGNYCLTSSLLCAPSLCGVTQRDESKLASDYFNPSTLLVVATGVHKHSYKCQLENENPVYQDCPLYRFIKHGADVTGMPSNVLIYPSGYYQRGQLTF